MKLNNIIIYASQFKNAKRFSTTFPAPNGAGFNFELNRGVFFKT